MSAYFETAMYIISNLFKMYIYYLFMNAFFKRSKRTNNLIIIAAFAGFFLLNTSAYLLASSTYLNLITNMLPCFLITFFYNSSLMKKVASTFIICSVGIFTDAFMVSIENVTGKKFLVISSSMATVLFQFLIEKIYEYFSDKNTIYSELKSKQMLMILSVPGASILLAMITMQERNLNYFIEAIILLGINVIVFYIYDSLQKAMNEKHRIDVLEEQNKSYENQLKLYQESVQKDRILRHDLKNHMFKIRDYAYNGKIDELRKYTEATIEAMDIQSVMSNTGNQEIDSILNYKCQKLRQMGAELHFDLNIPNEIKVENFDLTKLLGNLLDNVSDAIEKAQEKIVYIKIHYEKGVLSVCIRNTFNGQISVENGELQTIKENSEKHGFGFKSVKEVIEKYDGQIEYNYDNNVFSVFIIIYEK